MSGSRIELERFDGFPTEEDAGLAAAGAEAVEAARLEGYDSGYAAGWEDAAKSSREQFASVSAELARNLQDLGFTYHEVSAAMTGSLETLLRVLTERFFPGLSAEGLADTIRDLLADGVEASIEQPVILRASSSDIDTVRSLMPENVSAPIRLVEETTLASGQAYLKFATGELEVDLNGPLSALRGQISERLEIAGRRAVNG